MTNEEWVAYYLEHPNELLAFIVTANEQVERMAKEIDRLEAAQHGVQPTVLNVREIEVICPNCNLVFDVPVPESHSG